MCLSVGFVWRDSRIALTDARQLFSHKHVDDAASPENGLHDDPTGPVVGYLADSRGSSPQWMCLEHRQRRVDMIRGYNTDNIALVGKIEGVKTQELTEAFDLGRIGVRCSWISMPTCPGIGDLHSGPWPARPGGIPA